MRRVTVEVGEENNIIGVFVRDMEPYDSIVVLIYTALALLEGRAQVTFNDGPPLTDEEEQQIIASMGEGPHVVTGGHRSDN